MNVSRFIEKILVLLSSSLLRKLNLGWKIYFQNIFQTQNVKLNSKILTKYTGLLQFRQLCYLALKVYKPVHEKTHSTEMWYIAYTLIADQAFIHNNSILNRRCIIEDCKTVYIFFK